MDNIGQTPAASRIAPLGNEGPGQTPINPARSGDRPVEAAATSSTTQDRITLSRDAQLIMELSSADRQVRSHEAAHSAAGGQYTGSPSYTYRQGPDGKRYAVAGEVPIDVSPVTGDPEATLKKAQVIRAAALAPVDPSAQDLKVAAAAMQMALSAQADIQTAKRQETTETRLDKEASDQEEKTTPPPEKSTPTTKKTNHWYA